MYPARKTRSTIAPSGPSGLVKVNVSTIVVPPSRGTNSWTWRIDANGPRTISS